MTREEALEYVNNMWMYEDTKNALETLIPEFGKTGSDKVIDYEEKYNEALKRVRRLHDRMQVLSSTDALVASSELEFIFPELTESEDERIRKELIEAFEAYDIESKWNGIPIRSIFAWLEKQKEPLPIPDKFSGLKSLMLQYFQSAVYRKDDIEIESDTDLWGRKILEYVWKYSDEQKSAKWSEDTIRKAVKEAGLTQHQIDWFKNNVFPPKPEWSEEDEAMRDNILRLLSCFVGTLECDSNPSLSTSYPAYQREMDWLKSLRPSWKPSIEDLKKL